MEAKSAAALPSGDGFAFEPKWDGFRCVAFRDGDTIALQSKAGKPLTRYFPEVVAAVAAVKAKRFVVDGEIVVPSASGLDFDALLQRIHPSASRIAKLAAETPALYTVFDLLVDPRGTALAQKPLRDRRTRLEAFAARAFPTGKHAGLELSPSTTDRAVAATWAADLRGKGIDGMMAKALGEPYASGARTAMQKVKWHRSADCVVGGFRYASDGVSFGSLLLGLYDDDGLLSHVGFCSAIANDEKSALLAKLKRLRKAPGFTGRAPGGPSRWATERSTEWEPLAPKLVVEVEYDHFSGHRFRHGTKLLRYRPDKAPAQCTTEQLRLPPIRPARSTG